MIYSINYDLNRPGQNYSSLFEKIKSMGSWWHCLDSMWIISTNLNSSQICDRLTSELDSNDQLLVTRLNGESAWIGFSSDCSNWLKNELGNAIGYMR